MESSQLSKIAEEVNKKLKLIPILKTDANEGELIKQLKSLNDFVGFDRHLSGEAMEVIRSLKG
jgi:hypothetical protein